MTTVKRVLLACLQLKGVAPEVLTALPKLASQISIKAKDMVPQALSNSLWAFAQLKDDASHEDVAKLVAALVRQIPDKAKGMKPQEISNSLWAAARLKDDAPAGAPDGAQHSCRRSHAIRQTLNFAINLQLLGGSGHPSGFGP